MIIPQIKYAFTLSEILEYDPYDISGTLSDLLSSLGITYTIETGSKVSELFIKMLNHFPNEIVFIANKEDDGEEIGTKFRAFMCRFLNMYEDTKVYYEVLINAYEDKKASLLAKVKSSSENEVFFNDTPQNTGGVFSGVDYTTNYTKTKNENESDLNTPIARIKEISDSLEMYWKQWLEDIERLFIENKEEE